MSARSGRNTAPPSCSPDSTTSAWGAKRSSTWGSVTPRQNALRISHCSSCPAAGSQSRKSPARARTFASAENNPSRRRREIARASPSPSQRPSAAAENTDASPRSGTGRRTER